MKLDPRSNLLFVAGGPSGTGRVYDATSGAEVAFYQFRPASPFPPPPPPTTFINDVIVTRDAAYFTDSLYVVQNANNRVAVVELSPDFLSGAIVRYITEPFASTPATKVPTTIAEFGNSLPRATARTTSARHRRGGMRKYCRCKNMTTCIASDHVCREAL
jgi:hypothetical protein